MRDEVEQDAAAGAAAAAGACAPASTAAGVGGGVDRAAAVGAALGWSFTRHKLLRGCERAAYWHYWAARDGWRAEAARDRRLAYALKHLTAVPLLVGTAVHDAARAVMAAARDGRRPPTYDALLRTARGTLNRAWRDSQPDRIARFWQWPGDHLALHEVVYGGRIPPAAADAARVRLASCLRGLLATPLVRDVAACRDDEVYLAGDGPERVALDLPPGLALDARDLLATGAGLVGGGPAITATLWLALDLVYRHHDPGACHGLTAGDGSAAGRRRPGGSCWCVTDFKTGAAAPAEEALQLAVYALALQAAGLEPTDGVYLGRVVNVRTRAEAWYALGAEDLARARAVVLADVGRQLALVRRMIAPGTARPGSGSHAGADAGGEAAVEGGRSADAPFAGAAFALAPDRRRCPTCNFLALCRHELTRDVMPPDLGDAGAEVQPRPEVGAEQRDGGDRRGGAAETA